MRTRTLQVWQSVLTLGTGAEWLDSFAPGYPLSGTDR